MKKFSYHNFQVKFVSIFINYCRVMQILSLILLCYLAWIKKTAIGEFFFLLAVFGNATANRLIGYRDGLIERYSELKKEEAEK